MKKIFGWLESQRPQSKKADLVNKGENIMEPANMSCQL